MDTTTWKTSGEPLDLLEVEEDSWYHLIDFYQGKIKLNKKKVPQNYNSFNFIIDFFWVIINGGKTRTLQSALLSKGIDFFTVYYNYNIYNYLLILFIVYR